MRSKRSAFALLAVVLVLLACSALFGKFRSSYVCRKCGALARDTEWQTPFMAVALYRSDKTVEATPLSVTLSSIGLIAKDHAHDWWFISGSENGILCALGGGGKTAIAARMEETSRLIRAAHDSGETKFRDRLVRCIFQRATAMEVWNVALMWDEAMRGGSGFSEWIKKHEAEIEEQLKAAEARK